MSVLINEVTIDAPVGKIFEALATVDTLEKYDPTVSSSAALTDARSGIGAGRKVTMRDGKNWFQEQCTAWQENQSLTYTLTACSFPIHRLQHSYSLESVGARVRVRQVMDYTVKFGVFGKLMDILMIRRQNNKGIRLFLDGLKAYAEAR